MSVNKYQTIPIEVEAFQFTEQMARDYLLDKKGIPLMLSVSGNYHPEDRKVYDAYIWLSDLKERVEYGDWIVKSNERLIRLSNEEFKAKYQPTKPVTLEENLKENLAVYSKKPYEHPLTAYEDGFKDAWKAARGMR